MTQDFEVPPEAKWKSPGSGATSRDPSNPPSTPRDLSLAPESDARDLSSQKMVFSVHECDEREFGSDDPESEDPKEVRRRRRPCESESRPRSSSGHPRPSSGHPRPSSGRPRSSWSDPLSLGRRIPPSASLQNGRKRLQQTTCASGKDPSSSPYERMVLDLDGGDLCAREITLGKRVGFYRFKHDIGAGNFSSVKLGIHLLTKRKVAVKVLDRTRLDHKAQRMLSREISIMESLLHPHVIRLFEVVETLSKIHLVMEYAGGGELFAKVTNEGPLREPQARRVFAQIVSAVSHMHSRNLIHRDIKAENVFYVGPNEVKLGDFGFSTSVVHRDQQLKTFCGSPPYAAPELFQDDSYLGGPVDVWALGILLFFVVTGTMPFKAQTVPTLKRLILAGRYEIPDAVSRPCAHLVENTLRQDPGERFTVDRVRDAEWLRGDLEDVRVPDLVVERERDEAVARELERLGIREELLREQEERGIRSSVIGTKRILEHTWPWSATTSTTTTTATTPDLSPSHKPLKTRPAQKAERFLLRTVKSKACVLL